MTGLTTSGDRRSVRDAYPLSRLQAGMIYHAELAGDDSYYHDIYSLRVHGPWDESAMRTALLGLVDAHETLRTSFELTKFSEPLQIVHTGVEIPIEVIDLRELDAHEAEQALEAWRQAETRRPFDFGRPPLFRIVVHLLTGQRFQFWWSFHHSIMDGWSLHSAVAELFAGYAAIRAGRAPQFVAPRTRYRSFIALEREALKDPEHRRFWRDELAGAEPALLAMARKTAGSTGVGVHWADVRPDLLAGLVALAERLRVPVRTVLLAAHLRVTAGLLGRHDVITGVIGNGRPETGDVERVKGLFIGTYPFRLALAPVPWTDLVTAVHAKEVAIVPHRRYPLAAIVEETGWSPFEVLFDFRRFRSYESLNGSGDLRFEIGAYYEHTNYPLTSGFVMDPAGRSLRMQFRYDPTRLDRDDIARLARAYAGVLERIATAPDSVVLAVPLLADEDVAAIAAHAHGPARWVEDTDVYHRIARNVGSACPAVRTADGALTYPELLDTAGRIAGYLRDAGVRRGDPVGLCMNRGVLLLPAMLGILRIGAHYVPLDPQYPLARLRHITDDSGITVILHDRTAADVATALDAGSLGARVLPAEAAAAWLTVAEPVPVGPHELAYTIYTSGSTGVPKGVQVRHGAVVNLLDSLIDRLDLDACHTYLATTSISFDIHVNEMFVPLVLGAAVLLAARDQVSDGQALATLIDGETSLVGQGPPAMWRMLLDARWRPHAMAAVLCGGEAFPRDLASRLVGDGVPIWNMYGPTETTVWSAVEYVTGTGSTVPIGRPLWNTTLWLLDQDMHPVLPGVPGELYIGGAGVARAYHRRPGLTADRFVPDPFAGPADPGARLYRTGDLVRMTPEGAFQFLERVDLQVKVRGYRIELEEVEARLGAHPAVTAGVVAAPTGTDGERVLSGYVVAADGIDGTALRQWCAEALPPYMVPQAWVLLDALPMTPNGKVDRNALHALNGVDAKAADDGYVPVTDTEWRIAGIWREVLDRPSVGVNANFFDLGGHSLRALRVVLKTRQELGIDVPVTALITANTVRRFAAYVERHRGEAARPQVIPLNSTGHPPLFIFHPLGGHIFSYGPLARDLEGTVTLYGVRAAGLEAGESPLTSMAALVDSYVGKLRATQVDRPYHLAGWCMGATVALEVARKLRDEGDEVGYLGLIVADPDDPAPRALLESPVDLLLHAMGSGVDIDRDAVLAIPDLAGQVEYVYRRSLAGGMLREDVLTSDDAYRLLRLYQANATAISVHRTEKYDGEAHVYVLAEENPSPPDMGWSTVLSGPTHLHELPGDTGTFLTAAFVGRLAKLIDSAVDAAATPRSAGSAPKEMF
jgi:amino acid adenylation domain-containing protein